MTREQKSQLMKRAHENARAFRSTCATYREALAKGLHNAWMLFKANGAVKTTETVAKAAATVVAAGVREVAEVIVKSWFLNKNYSQNERYAISTANRTFIEKETEKAVFVKFDTDNGIIKGWLPKSVVTING